MRAISGALGLLLVVLLGPQGLLAQDITSNLVGQWRMEEGTGTTVADSSSTGANLACVNTPTWVTGQRGAWALAFAAASSQQCNVSITTSSPLWPNASDFTVAAWVKRASIGANHGIAGHWSPNNEYWYFRFGTGNVLELRLSADSTNVATVAGTGTITDTTTWHHVAVVAARATAATFYIDGVAGGTPSIAAVVGSINLATATPFCVGCIGDTAGAMFFDGALDDVHVFNRALSAADIAALMAAPTGRKRGPLFLN